MLQYLRATNSTDIIPGYFNIALLKVSENKLLDIITDHVQIVIKPTHVSGFFIDQVYIKKAFSLI